MKKELYFATARRYSRGTKSQSPPLARQRCRNLNLINIQGAYTASTLTRSAFESPFGFISRLNRQSSSKVRSLLPQASSCRSALLANSDSRRATSNPVRIPIVPSSSKGPKMEVWVLVRGERMEDRDCTESVDWKSLHEYRQEHARRVQAKRNHKLKRLVLIKACDADTHSLSELIGYLGASIEDREFARAHWGMDVISQGTWSQILAWMQELREWRLEAQAEDLGEFYRES